MQIVRVFIASPGDVAVERDRAEQVCRRLNGRYFHSMRFESTRWESFVYSAHLGIQDALERRAAPYDHDIVVGVFGGRLGTPLPDAFLRMAPPPTPRPATWPEDAGVDEIYASGSTFEVMSSICRRLARDAEAAAGETVKPDVFVFRRAEPPQVSVDDEGAVAAARAEWRRLEEFFARFFGTPGAPVRAATTQFDDADDFERLLEQTLETWLAAAHRIDPGVTWPWALSGSPFRGLEAFEYKDSSVYFGRARKVERALERFKVAARDAEAQRAKDGEAEGQPRAPFLLVVGPSGCGKSSFMRAGLAPRIAAPGAVAGVDHWRLAVMRPTDGATPLASFAARLFVTAAADGSGAKGEDPGGFGPALPELAQGVAGDPAGFARLAARDPAAAAAAVARALDSAAERLRDETHRDRDMTVRLLVLVDQLEEIFASAVSPEDRERFLCFLTILLRSGRVWAVATARDDLYGKLIGDRTMMALKDSGAGYDLAAPSESELAEIIRESARAAGLRYAVDTESGRHLDEILLDETVDKDALPLLQLALSRLFDDKKVDPDGAATLTVAAYRRIGGVFGVINITAEEAIAALPNGEALAARELPRLLRSLAATVRPDAERRGGWTLRAASYAEACGPRDRARALVDALVDARALVRSQSEGGTPMVRLAHQRILTNWERARRVVELDQRFFRVRDEIEAQRAAWLAAGRAKDRLLTGGLVDDGVRLLRAFSEEIPPDLADYITRSRRAARRRRRLLTDVAVVSSITAVAAGALFFTADAQRTRADFNFAAAQNTADEVVETVATSLRQIDGVPQGSIVTALDQVRSLLEGLEERNPTIARRLVLNRARILVELARTKARVDADAVGGRNLEGRVDIDAARADLAAALALLEGRDPPFESAQALDLQAEMHALLGDFARNARSQEGDAEAFERYRRAVALRERAYVLARDTDDFLAASIRLSQALTRLGDRQRFRQDVSRDEASALELRDYDRSLFVVLGVFEGNEGDPDLLREIAWALRKQGDARFFSREEGRGLSFSERALCVRRRLLENDPTNALLRADVAWSLSRTARALAAAGRPREARLQYLEAEWLAGDIARNNKSEITYQRDWDLRIWELTQFLIANDEPALAAAFAQRGVTLRSALQPSYEANRSLLGPFGRDPVTPTQLFVQATTGMAPADIEQIQLGGEALITNALIEPHRAFRLNPEGSAACFVVFKIALDGLIRGLGAAGAADGGM